MARRLGTAIVTGGSGAIGMAISNALATAGAHVVITGRRHAALADAVRLLQQRSGSTTISAQVADVTKEPEVAELFSQVAALHGDIDLLVNCAGIAVGGPTAELRAADFSRVLDTNVLGPFICAKAAFRHMGARSGGRIINVGSISAFSPRPHSAPYTTSKFAVQGLTRSLALDGRALNVAVGAVHPGNVISELLSEEEVTRRQESEGFITAEEVAECVLTMAKMPLSANVLELTVLPTRQPLVGRG